MEIIIVYPTLKHQWAWCEPKSRVAYGPFATYREATEDAEIYAKQQRKLQNRDIIVSY